VFDSTVGSANGEFTLYEIGLREMLLSKPFKIRDINACSAQFQVFIYIQAVVIVVVYLCVCSSYYETHYLPILCKECCGQRFLDIH